VAPWILSKQLVAQVDVLVGDTDTSSTHACDPDDHSAGVSRDAVVRLRHAISEIGVSAFQADDFRHVARAICDEVLAATDACLVGMWLVSQEGELLEPVVAGELGEAAKRTTLAAKAVQSGATERAPGGGVAVPLVCRGESVGALVLEPEPGVPLNPRDVGLVEEVGDAAAVVVAASEARRQKLRNAHRMGLLHRLSRIITSTVDLEELLQRTVEGTRELLEVDFVAIGLLDADGEQVVLRAMSSAEPTLLKVGHTQGLGVGLAGEVALNQRARLVRPGDGIERIPTSAEPRFEMSAPLKHDGTLLGVLHAERLHPACGPADLRVLEAIGDHIAQAIANAEALERLASSREDMVSMLVHDLRNPLTLIAASIDQVGHGLSRGTSAASLLDDIDLARQGCQNLEDLIEGLLLVQRLDARDSGRIECDQWSLQTIAEDIVRRSGPAARMSALELTLSVRDEVPLVHVDRSLVSRAVDNLIGNALKFTPAQGHIHVVVRLASDEDGLSQPRRASDYVCLEVSDTGPGVPFEERERIFDRFAVGHLSGRGSGLGLPLCRLVAEAHGGIVRVGASSGTGSTFEMFLPVALSADL